MFATAEGQRQTGEKTWSMRVWETGLGSSFRRWVTAKAVAVAASRMSARIVGAFRIGPRLYAAHSGRQPDDERSQTDPDADGDHVGRLRHVEQLDAAEREHAGEPEPERVLRDLERVAAGDPDAGDRAEQEPRHRMQVDVALDEMADAGDPEQGSGVEDVRADDLRHGERVDHHHHETEEGSAADGGQADDEPEDRADQHGPDLVLPSQHERRVARL